MVRRPPGSTHFRYTPRFRSDRRAGTDGDHAGCRVDVEPVERIAARGERISQRRGFRISPGERHTEIGSWRISRVEAATATDRVAHIGRRLVDDDDGDVDRAE